MDITQYEEITGTTVPATQTAFVTAQINKTQRILETLLGYTLDPTLVMYNQFTGAEPEAAFRLFTYRQHDRYFHIDPASEVHQVLLVSGDEVIETLDLDDDYAVIKKFGFTKYIDQKHTWWCVCRRIKKGLQIAVDANWLWEGDEYSVADFPDDLLMVWADMITYYSDTKHNIKSETLATHRYEKFSDKAPEFESHNLAVIKKYAGGNGSAVRQLTI